ncbi:hypothetical protein ACJZ2D_013956 [Fusarium nematophilum]
MATSRIRSTLDSDPKQLRPRPGYVIAEKWIEEALALPVDPMYEDIIKGRVYRELEEGDNEHEEEDWRHRYLKRLKAILDRDCVEYHRRRQDPPVLLVDKYQWLPSNLKFRDDGSVRFASYINNLHPVKHRGIYGTIEKLIEKALPAWDFCLALYESFTHVGGGRTDPRFPRPIIQTDGAKLSDENESNWDPREEDVQVPPPREDGDDQSGDDDEGDYYGSPQHVQWLKIREPIQPGCPDFVPWGYGVKPGQTLRERFKDTGLQPDFPPGGWHVEGQMNEHIVGTALYYLGSGNVTPSHLHFRMQTDSYKDDWDVS